MNLTSVKLAAAALLLAVSGTAIHAEGATSDAPKAAAKAPPGLQELCNNRFSGAAGQAGNKLKQLFYPTGARRTFSSVPVAAPAAPMATITVRSLADGTANAANCPGANCRLRDAIAKALAN